MSFILLGQLTSCILIRIVPTIETDTVVVGKKFKRSLPKKYAFIFEDPKDADEFYLYVNTKYEREHNDVKYNVPFTIENTPYYFSIHEIGIPTKTINLLPILWNAKLEERRQNPIAENLEHSRKDKWYIAITDANETLEDCLEPEFKDRDALLDFLRATRVQYITRHNYTEALLKK